MSYKPKPAKVLNAHRNCVHRCLVGEIHRRITTNFMDTVAGYVLVPRHRRKGG